MQSIKLKILDREGHTYLTCAEGDTVSLVYTAAYREGDRVALECCEPGCWCVVQFEDTLPPALVYVARREINYTIPFGENRIVFSPKSFTGERHLIRARLASAEEIAARRNLAFNPFDQHGDNGFFPHASANVETRGEAVFAAYNAIDGVPVSMDRELLTDVLRGQFGMPGYVRADMTAATLKKDAALQEKLNG